MKNTKVKLMAYSHMLLARPDNQLNDHTILELKSLILFEPDIFCRFYKIYILALVEDSAVHRPIGHLRITTIS